MLDLSSGSHEKEEVVALDELIDNSMKLAMNIEKANLVRPVKVVKDYKSQSKLIGNKMNLEKALTNIIQNSLYYINQKTKQTPEHDGQINLSLEETEEMIKIIITDNGIGIEESVLESKQFMEPFYTTKPTGEGVGLGLSITNDIIVHHNGELSYSRNNEILKAMIIFKR